MVQLEIQWEDFVSRSRLEVALTPIHGGPSNQSRRARRTLSEASITLSIAVTTAARRRRLVVPPPPEIFGGVETMAGGDTR